MRFGTKDLLVTEGGSVSFFVKDKTEVLCDQNCERIDNH